MDSFVMQRCIYTEERNYKEVLLKCFEDLKPYSIKEIKPTIRYSNGIYFIDTYYQLFPYDKEFYNDLKTLMDLIKPFYSNQLRVPFRVVISEHYHEIQLKQYSVVICSEIISRSGHGYFEEVWLNFNQEGKLIESNHKHWSECGYPPSTYEELNKIKMEIEKLINFTLDNPLDILKHKNKYLLGS